MTKIWNEGNYAFIRDDLGRLWRRQMDMVHFIYHPWAIVEEIETKK